MPASELMDKGSGLNNPGLRMTVLQKGFGASGTRLQYIICGDFSVEGLILWARIRGFGAYSGQLRDDFLSCLVELRVVLTLTY